MPFHKNGVYDGFDSLEEARQHYKRCRKTQHFILSDNGVVKEKPHCTVCGGLIEVGKDVPLDLKGNRGEYYQE